VRPVWGVRANPWHSGAGSLWGAGGRPGPRGTSWLFKVYQEHHGWLALGSSPRPRILAASISALRGKGARALCGECTCTPGTVVQVVFGVRHSATKTTTETAAAPAGAFAGAAAPATAGGTGAAADASPCAAPIAGTATRAGAAAAHQGGRVRKQGLLRGCQSNHFGY
jgi:hypothetical protein